MSAVYTLGIDVGSTASKCIILKDGKEIVAKSLIDVGAGTSGPQRAIDAVLAAAGMTRDQMAYVLATGYGRNSLMGLADKQMSELSCHARGASFLFPEAPQGGRLSDIRRRFPDISEDYEGNQQSLSKVLLLHLHLPHR